MWYSLSVQFKLYHPPGPPAFCVGGIFLFWWAAVSSKHSHFLASLNRFTCVYLLYFWQPVLHLLEECNRRINTRAS